MHRLTADYEKEKSTFVKNPMLVEFLGLSHREAFTESKLEQAILDHLEHFLMEMGKGYALVNRQMHIHTEDDDYYIDLVFYNYLLKCFVLGESKKFQEMLEATIQEYHDRRKFLSEQEAGATQEATAESIIRNATEQALNILRGMQADRESFRKLGLTFEEKAFYDILIHLRDKNNFEYGEDREVDGIVVNDKCKSLACKIRDIIDAKSSFADWLNNQRVRDQLKQDIKICLVKNGYPPRYTPEVFREVMEQVENFKENEGVDDHISTYVPIGEERTRMMKAADENFIYAHNNSKQ
ncbi:MAG: PDDEXK nuclease domain-containing protein [Parabacteroides sp.]|nr:PDDEXK nuclease domain-containing protein [Parabacteroides sp.]